MQYNCKNNFQNRKQIFSEITNLDLIDPTLFCLQNSVQNTHPTPKFVNDFEKKKQYNSHCNSVESVSDFEKKKGIIILKG